MMMNDDQIQDHLDDLLAQWELACEEGRQLTVADLCRDLPELEPALRQRIDRLRGMVSILVDQTHLGTDDAGTVSQGGDDTFCMESDLTVPQFVALITNSGVLTDEELDQMCQHADVGESVTASTLAETLIQDGLLTRYQADVILSRGNRPLLLDRYVILDTLGSGGTGVVFKALHRSVERIVAIKVLPDYVVNSPEKVQRFQRKVVSVARLLHPNVVSAFDAHRQDVTYFLVMEYVDGDNLRDCINDGGTLAIDDAVSLIDQVASGLSAAHAQGA